MPTKHRMERIFCSIFWRLELKKYPGTDERFQALTQKEFVLRLATVLLPLDSTVFYPDGNLPGQSGGKEWKREP